MLRWTLLRHRPALVAASALAVGIALETNTNTSSLFWLAVASTFWIIAGVARNASFVRTLAITIAFIALGAFAANQVRTSYQRTWIANLTKFNIERCAVEGRIAAIQETETSYLATLECSSLAIDDRSAVPVHEDVLLRISKDALLRSSTALPQLGSTVRAYGALERFRGATNPHEYASSLALQRRTEASCMLLLRSGFDLYVLAPPTASIWSEWNDVVNSAHSWIAGQLDGAIRDQQTRAFVKAVVLGDREEMSPETLDNFTTAGVAHILAVSGFNVAIVAVVIAQLLRMFGLYWRKTRTIITMIAIVAYAAIVGWQPSVVRALAMIELYFLASLLERKPDPLNIVASAAAFELLFRPLDLFDVGFQLSYSAVLGLILIAPEIKRLFGISEEQISQTYLHRFGHTLALSIGASIASYPVIVSHFFRISFVGLVANIPVIPLSAFITSFGFLLIPLRALSGFIGHLYGDALTYLTTTLLWITKLSAQLPAASSSAAAPSWLYLVLFVLSVLYVSRSSVLKIVVGRLVLVATFFVALRAIGAPLTDSLLRTNEGTLQVLFFDVGQGDCIYIRTPNNNSYLVDFGSADVHSASVRAEQTALPFLRAEGSTQILAGFISHMHRDHVGGAASVLEHANVAQFFSSGERSREPLAASLERKTQKRETRLRTLSAGDTLHLDSDVTLYTLHPTRSAPHAQYTRYGLHANNGSLAFKICYGRTNFLFLGDIEASDERQLVSEYGSFLHSDVVKVAHHGSLSSSSSPFVRSVGARYAVISVGAHNGYGHPAPVVVRRWMGSGASVHRTDASGALLLVSDGRSVTRCE